VTGVEAISNGVSAFRKPEWKNAQQTLVFMGVGLGIMFLGLSFLASVVKVAPYEEGTPTVISQVGELVYGHGSLGSVLYYSLQAGTMLILVLAANTGFADFPRLASFQAGDSFLPRQLTKRGHRLVYSNGVLVLAGAAMVLVVATQAVVTRLIPLYAIGVFTGFTLSQAGMTKHHLRRRERGWRKGLVINGTGAVLSLLVTLIIAITKFADGAWVILVVLPVLVVMLLRLNGQYRREADELEHDVPAAVVAPVLRRHVVLVFIDRIDMAAARAIQYGRTHHTAELRAVHFALDEQVARDMASEWQRLGLSRVPLEIVECPDRRLTKAAVNTVARELADGETEVTVLLPHRKFRGPWHRILHDRTADAIEEQVSRLPHANVTSVPFHLGAAHELDTVVDRHQIQRAIGAVPNGGDEPRPPIRGYVMLPMADVRWRDRVTVRGRVRAMRVAPQHDSPTLELVLQDETASMSVVFLGRRELAGVHIGTVMEASGTVGLHKARLAILNPRYRLLADQR
jgi:hypothetical protein